MGRRAWCILRTPEPTFTGGVNTTLSWKGLQLSVVGEFKGGNKVMIIENRYLTSDGAQMSMNQQKGALNYWKKPGDTGCNPKPIAGNATNSNHFTTNRWIEKGDYFRIKDITLSYQLPQSLLNKVGLKSTRVYASGLNVYTFHDVNFWDPERGIDGLGYGIYPVSKSFIVGVVSWECCLSSEHFTYLFLPSTVSSVQVDTGSHLSLYPQALTQN